MNEHEKGNLYNLQKSVIARFRDRWQRDVEESRQQVEILKQTALELGIPIGDIVRLNAIEQGILGIGAAVDLESVSYNVTADPETERRPARLLPLLRKKADSVVAPKLPALSGKIRPTISKCDFRNIDRRIKEINREILVISRRFKELSVGKRMEVYRARAPKC
jgi:hypothetical protein